MSDLADLPGGAFTMGTDGTYGYPQDCEGPAHEVVVSPFAIARQAVSNREFRAFVDASGHRTAAESFGWSFVFAGQLAADFGMRPVGALDLTRTLRRSAPGAAPASRPRPNGSSRRAAGSRGCASPAAPRAGVTA